jgi:hypothetical protein
VINDRHQARDYGLAGQLSWQESLIGHANLFIAGAALDISSVHFGGVAARLHQPRPQHRRRGCIRRRRRDRQQHRRRALRHASTSPDGPAPGPVRDDTLALESRAHLTLSGRYNHTTVKSRDAIVPGGGPDRSTATTPLPG